MVHGAVRANGHAVAAANAAFFSSGDHFREIGFFIHADQPTGANSGAQSILVASRRIDIEW